MAQQIINIGTADAKDGDTLFDAFTKTNANFTDLYGQVGNLGANNVVVVNSESDFPEPVAGVITLEDNKVYHIGGDPIVTSNRFVCGQNNLITSGNPFAVSLVYTGSGTMFTGTDVYFALDRIVVDCANAQAFDFKGSGNGETFGLNLAVVSRCQKVGVFDDLRAINITNSSCFNATDGISVTGVTHWDTLTVSRFRIVTSSGSCTGIDLTTSLHKTFEISDFVLEGVLGSVGISGLTNSGNITTGFVGNFTSCEFPSPITPLSGILPSDVRYNFVGNSNVSDSQNAGDLFLENGSETITVSSTGTFYEIGTPTGGANWNADITDRFVFNSAGYLTYIGEREIDAEIIATATVEKAGGGSDIIEMRIGTNWTPGNSGLAKSKSQTQNGQPTSITSIALTKLNNGDTIRPIFTNNGSTSNIIVEVTSMVVKG